MKTQIVSLVGLVFALASVSGRSAEIRLSAVENGEGGRRFQFEVKANGKKNRVTLIDRDGTASLVTLHYLLEQKNVAAMGRVTAEKERDRLKRKLLEEPIEGWEQVKAAYLKALELASKDCEKSDQAPSALYGRIAEGKSIVARPPCSPERRNLSAQWVKLRSSSKPTYADLESVGASLEKLTEGSYTPDLISINEGEELASLDSDDTNRIANALKNQPLRLGSTRSFELTTPISADLPAILK